MASCYWFHPFKIFWIAYCIEKVQLYQIGRKIKLNWKLKRFSYSFGCKNKTVRFVVESLGLTAWLCEPYAVRKHNLIRIIYACKVLLSYNLSSNMVICCVVAMSCGLVFGSDVILYFRFFFLASYKLPRLITKIFNGNFHGAWQKILRNHWTVNKSFFCRRFKWIHKFGIATKLVLNYWLSKKNQSSFFSI